jgi:hypothetical protein
MGTSAPIQPPKQRGEREQESRCGTPTGGGRGWAEEQPAARSLDYSPCSPLHMKMTTIRPLKQTTNAARAPTGIRTWLAAPTFDREVGNYNPCDHAGHSRSHQGDAPGHGEAIIAECLSCGAEQSQKTAGALCETVCPDAHLGACYATYKLLAAAICRHLSYLVRRVIVGPYPWRYLKIVSGAVFSHGCCAASRAQALMTHAKFWRPEAVQRIDTDHIAP